MRDCSDMIEENDEFSNYHYSAFVTDLDGFCCEEFGATEAAFRWVCVAHNLMSLYKIALINSKHDPTLATLKFQCIVFFEVKISNELIRIKYFYENVLLFSELVYLYMEFVKMSLKDVRLICVYLRFQQITPINDTQVFFNL